MPIAPRFHIEHIHKLALQMKRAPTSVRLLQIKAIEKLTLDIEDEVLYPLDYVVYRITKYRGDELIQPMLLGSALIGDLVATVAIVSRTLDIPADDTLTIEETANQLGVSTRTISRLRREGLVFRWVIEKSGRRCLGCQQHMLTAFKEKQKNRIHIASNFTRLTPSERKEIVEIALTYSGSGRSLSDVAAELSRSTTRGHETIRSLLSDSSKAKKALQKPPPLSRKDARVIERAIHSGIPWSTLVKQYQRTASTLRKAVARLRATRLKQLEIAHLEFEVFKRDDAEEIILNTPGVLQVSPPLLQLDLQHFGEPQNTLSEADEIAVVSAMHLLRRRAKQLSRQLSYVPSETVLDRIETDLRWSFLLQQQLILQALPSAIAVAIQHAGRPLHELPSSQVFSLMEVVIQTVATVCGLLDPTKGQVTHRTPAAALDRHLSASPTTQLHERAAARQAAPIFTFPFHGVILGSTLIPKRDVLISEGDSSSTLTTLLALRFGWNEHPRTIVEIAEYVGRSKLWVKRQLRAW